MITFILAICIAMSVSFLCSIMEAAILSLNPGKLAILQQKKPKAGKYAPNLKETLKSQ